MTTFPPRLTPAVGALVTLAAVISCPLDAQQAGRDSAGSLPIRPQIRRAIADGTRDWSGRPGPRYWRLAVAYDLSATLDPPNAVVNGDGRVRIVNASPHTLDRIQLRLDQNRFRAEHAGDLPPESRTDGLTVTRLSVDGRRAELGGRSSSVLPRLEDPTATSTALHLARPLGPGDSITIAISWRFTVPAAGPGDALRLGRQGTEVFQVAQWYPRVAMFDDLDGWDDAPHTGAVEFYSPFARYRVRLTVPAGWLIGATGTLQNADRVLSKRTRDRLASAARTDAVVVVATPAETAAGTVTSGGGALTWEFAADSVRDFAWGASPRYRWTSTRALIPGVASIMLHALQLDGLDQEDGANLPSVRSDLLVNSRLVGPYPFPQHTLLGGPEGGMEYPMLTMSNGDGRLTHELWHQWFPMLVGTDESRHSFLDEGLATYLAAVTDAARRGTALPRSTLRRTPLEVPLLTADPEPTVDPRRALYGYGRVAPMLEALSDSFGQARVLEALRLYVERWRYRHPSPWDFMHTFNDLLGADLAPVWRRWLFETAP